MRLRFGECVLRSENHEIAHSQVSNNSWSVRGHGEKKALMNTYGCV